jgi:hypothetical protein
LAVFQVDIPVISAQGFAVWHHRFFIRSPLMSSQYVTVMLPEHYRRKPLLDSNRYGEPSTFDVRCEAIRPTCDHALTGSCFPSLKAKDNAVEHSDPSSRNFGSAAGGRLLKRNVPKVAI